MVKRLDSAGPDYPMGLADLENPPPISVRGTLSDKSHVAIVGTRTCTRYGIEIAMAMGRKLAEVGIVTVSGLARGIDAAAHRGTVAGRGRGVAILGSGLDFVYPAENKGLARQLIDLGGAIISEYSDDTPPDRWRFPARNRLIAAMAMAVVVVESKAKGGAQITAILAAELGRPVLAVPGDVNREASAGTNQLIRDGAIPVFGADDLIAELSLLGIAGTNRPATDTILPEAGVDIEDLPRVWACTLKEALVRLGQLEGAGVVRRVGDQVMPVTGSGNRDPIP